MRMLKKKYTLLSGLCQTSHLEQLRRRTKPNSLVMTTSHGVTPLYVVTTKSNKSVITVISDINGDGTFQCENHRHCEKCAKKRNCRLPRPS
jgi:hypothetical protein